MRARIEPGALTGIVLSDQGMPMAGVCVSAQPATGPFRPVGKVAVTTQAGMYDLSGLTAGSYDLTYRNCAGPGGVIAWPSRAALSPAALLTPSTPSRAYVVPGRMIKLSPVRVRFTRGSAAAAMMPALSTIRPRMISRTRRDRHGSATDWGGVSGTVLGPHHRPLAGICVEIFGSTFIEGVPTGTNGKYNTGKNLAPGKYPVEFGANCDVPFAPPPSNWAPQWYRNKYHQATANPVVVRPGGTTMHIDAVLRRGAVITGTVTGRRHRGVAGVCVVATAPNGIVGEGQVTTPVSGRYRIQGLDPGRIRVGFFPGCGYPANAYLPQWWPGKSTEAKSGLIKLGFGSHRSHVDAKLMLGGTISGVIKFRNGHGRPIRGICVFVQPANQPFAIGFEGASLADGFYSVRGLPAGRYSVSFGPGCDNNGNYLYQNYPHNVSVQVSRVTPHINAYLQPGAIIAGTVTDKATGKPLSGICVFASDGMAETGRDGTYYANQITPGRTTVDFANCDNRGSYAPQYYPGQINPAAAAVVSLRGGVTTAGIDAAMTPGATISGQLTLPSGHGIGRVCADAVPTGAGLPANSSAIQSGYFAESSAGGRYAVENLPPGQYQVAFGTCDGPNVADQWFMGQRDPNKAAEINLADGQHVAQINAVVHPAGLIEGIVNGPRGQQGSFACVSVINVPTGVESFETPLLLTVGVRYAVGGLATGSYLVEFQPCGDQNLASQWYDDANGPGSARPVHVTAGHVTRSVNANLLTGGSITGRVFSKSTGKPMANVCVYAAGTSQPFFGFGSSNRSGYYRVIGLNTGVYRLFFSGCGSAHLLQVRSRQVKATTGQTVPGPDASMTTFRPGAISGRVKAGAPGPAPLPGACVTVLPAANGSYSLSAAYGQAGIGGYYQIGDLVPGKYKVNFDPSCVTEAEGQVPQWYDAKSYQSTATIVTVGAGRTTHRISATLAQDGSITGTVAGPGHQSLTGICVQAVAAAGTTPPFLAVSVGTGGNYNLGPVNPGRYLVKFSSGCGATGYATQWWRDVRSPSRATVVVVRSGVTRHGIDATMARGG